MLGKVWSVMIILSFIYAIMAGKIDEICNASIDGATKAIEMIITISGSMIFWSGIMKIAQDSGFTQNASKILFPILKFLFPTCLEKNNILNPICVNIVSNMLGLGNAATPSGIKAINEMKSENLLKENILTFLIINLSCIQLTPTFLVSLRKSFGSTSPYEIVPKMWASSFIFLIVGITMSKTFYKDKKISKPSSRKFKCLSKN